MIKTKSKTDDMLMVSRYLSSALNATEFAKQEGVSTSSVYRAKRKYDELELKKSKKLQFVSIDIKPPVCTTGVFEGISITYSNGVTLQIQSPLSIGQVQELLKIRL